MAKQQKRKQEKFAGEFSKKGKKIITLAEEQGLLAINNRAKLFIDGHPDRRWWLADPKKNMLISVEYGLCDSEVLAMLKRNVGN